MKKNLIALAVAALGLGSSLAFATQPGAVATGGGLVGSQVGGVAFSANGGTSQSGASNQQSATISVQTQTGFNQSSPSQNGVSVPTTSSIATQTITGSTTSSGYAYNLSTGSGWGGAASQGVAVQAGIGAESVQTIGSGDGVEASGTVDQVVAGKNSGSGFAAQTGGTETSTVGVVESTSTSGSSNSISNPKTITDTDTFTANTSGSTYANTEDFDGVYTTNVYNGSGQITGQSINFGSTGGVSTVASEGAANTTNVAGGVFGAQAQAGGVISSSQGPLNLDSGPLAGAVLLNGF